MRFFGISRNYKNITRLIKIVSIVGKYGFNAVLSRMKSGLSSVPSRIFNIQQEASLSKLAAPERLRLALEELGPTFIKMGQIMSLRPDIIPPEYARELEKLQDRTPCIPFDEIRNVIEEELGQEIGEVFSSIDEEPVASASIAQVHRAVLREDGSIVAVKVLKPGTRRLIQTDLNIIRLLAKLAQNHFPELMRYRPVELVQEFTEVLLGELDFLREANTIERFSRFFKKDNVDFVHIPKVYREHTTESVLVMEYINGIKISDIEALEREGLDRKAIAYNGARMTLKEIFEFGFYHADPHPGNIFVLPGNVVAPVDFGITGYVDNEDVRVIGNILLGLIERDAERLIRFLKRYRFIPEDGDERRMKIDLYDIIDRVNNAPLSQIDVPSSLQALFLFSRKYRLSLPSEYFLIFKTLLEVDGLGRKLCPDFNVTEVARPYVGKWFVDQYNPVRYLREMSYVLDDMSHLVRAVPEELGSVMRKFVQGRLRIPLFHENLDRAVSEIDRIGNRLSFAIIIAALLLSSSILVQSKIGPFIKGYPVIGLAGFLAAAVMGLWLIIGIIRSGKL
jgi:ubiquinone biosynthesis protein